MPARTLHIRLLLHRQEFQMGMKPGLPRLLCRSIRVVPERKLSVTFVRTSAPVIGWVEFWSETVTVTVCVSPAVTLSDATPMDKSKDVELPEVKLP